MGMLTGTSKLLCGCVPPPHGGWTHPRRHRPRLTNKKGLVIFDVWRYSYRSIEWKSTSFKTALLSLIRWNIFFGDRSTECWELHRNTKRYSEDRMFNTGCAIHIILISHVFFEILRNFTANSSKMTGLFFEDWHPSSRRRAWSWKWSLWTPLLVCTNPFT